MKGKNEDLKESSETRWVTRANVTLVLCSLAAGLIVSELIVGFLYYPHRHGTSYYSFRKMVGGEGRIFEYDADVGYRLSPNRRIKREKPPGLKNAPRRQMFYDLEINDLGFRYSHTLSAAKPPEEIRIFCMGGSTTFGAEVPNSGTYPQQLEGLLADPQIKVINAGVGGYRTIHLSEYYKKFIRPLYPDIVTIYEGWNDYEDSMFDYWRPRQVHGHCMADQMKMEDSPWARSALAYLAMNLAVKFRNKMAVRLEGQPSAAEDLATAGEVFMRGAIREQWQNEFRENLLNLVELIKSDGAVPVLIIPSPQFENAPAEAKAFSNQDLNMFGRWDAFVQALGIMRSILRSVARTEDIPLVDVNASFDAYNNDYVAKFLLFADRMHLTKEGNALIARAMREPIRGLAENVRKGRIKASQEALMGLSNGVVESRDED